METEGFFITSDMQFYIALGISLLYLIIGLQVFFINWKSVLSRRFLSFATIIAGWAASLSLAFYVGTNNPDLAIRIVEIGFLFIIFLPVAIYILLKNIPYTENLISSRTLYIVWTVNILIAAVYAYNPKLFFIFTILSTGEPTFSAGPLYVIFATALPLYIYGGIRRYFFVYTSSIGRERGIFAVGFYGILAAAFGALATNLFLPVLGYERALFWFGQAFPLVGVISLGYSISEMSGFHGRKFISRFFSSTLFLGLGTQMIIAQNIEQGILSALLFGLGAFVILIMQRDVAMEQVDRERIRSLMTDLRKNNQELKQADRAKTEFLTIASHHLRTPLTLIKWSLGSFLKGEHGELQENQREIMEKLQERNERLVRFVTSLLDVSHFERGMLLKKEAMYPGMIFYDIAKNLKPFAKQHAVIMYIDEQLRNLPAIQGDAQLISRMLENLIENGILYNRPEGELFCSGKVEGGVVMLFIRDTGIGIREDELKNIGEKFYRADNARRAVAEGTGVGVFLAREIARLHKGLLDISSKENKGTTMTIRLPLGGKKDSSNKRSSKKK